MDASPEEGQEGEGEEANEENEEEEEEDDDKKCLQVIRCKKAHVPSLSFWTFQAFKTLTCGQKSFSRRKNPSLRTRKLPDPTVLVIPFLHRSFSRGLLSSGHGRVKSDSVRCFPSCGLENRMRETHVSSVARVDTFFGTKGNKTIWRNPGIITDGSLPDARSESLRDSSSEHTESQDAHSHDGSLSPSLRKADISMAMIEEKGERKELEFLEIDMMKERFAKLLLGEDMSGGAKGVCTALAISNAITNLSASIFGELWRLEPLPSERKAMWRRELEWLICVSDHIVELVPSWQKFADGNNSFEVMVAKPRPDVQTNLPALRKLDMMLLEFLDSCRDTEFWYVEQGVNATDDNEQNNYVLVTQREEGKWWLPTPKVASTGLSDAGRKNLQHQRECINQILKAAMEINSQVLSEMQVPDAYWEALPKNAKSSLGETIYRHMIGESFCAEAMLHTLDLSTEHNAVEIANRIEAAIHVWRCRRPFRKSGKYTKHTDLTGKHSWVIMKDNNGMDTKRREILARRAESLLLCLKQKFPGLRQSLLDMTKIQFNRDVGQSILESYSRVMESLAFNIIARIDDVLFVDDTAKGSIKSPPPLAKSRINVYFRKGYSLTISSTTPFASPLATPLSSTPSTSPRGTSFHSGFDRV